MPGTVPGICHVQYALRRMRQELSDHAGKISGKSGATPLIGYNFQTGSFGSQLAKARCSPARFDSP